MKLEGRHGALYRRIHRLFGGETVAGMDDGEVLERFVARSDESAFEALVARFGPMVLGVCTRMLDDPHDAEDAFQATFLILVRRAGSIRDGRLLGNWLYGVAYRVAARARSNALRRRRREVVAEDEAVAPSREHERDWSDLRRVIDEELNRLPEKYRAPVCLCYLQGRSYEEAARRLRWPIGTVRSRLAKARELLRTRLVRREVVLPAGLLAAALQTRATQAAVSPVLLEETVTSAMRVVAARGISAAAVSAGVSRLSQEAMRAMVLSQLKWVAGLALLAGGVGTGTLILATRPRGGDAQGIPRAIAERDGSAPARPALVADDGPRAADRPSKPSAEGPNAADAETSRAVRQLVEQLKKHPARISPARERCGLYLIDVDRGGVMHIAEEPEPGLTHCGSPNWSADGRRIVFDATPRALWNRTRLRSIALAVGAPSRTDLGPGNCPSLAPDGRRIGFLLNPGAVPGAEPGVWLMEADGSGRRLLGGFGRVKWAPDGRRLLLVAFQDPAKPTALSLVDPETGRVRPIAIPGRQIFSVPSWAGDGTLVATIGRGDLPESIALLDVTDPEAVAVKEILWTRENALAPAPSYPVYSPSLGRCVFVGEVGKVRGLYAIGRGRPGPPRPLERGRRDHAITDLAISPDGRYVIFCSDRPHET